ncbi:MAG TPA: hydroxysqualene dehydroxylase HpnE [Vicinamibacterales bacterium]|jgi:squalene-associated FAD-dependent desaturase|nr:hydroxysqualene dehydroxylase HpnE [Vicinamibacterales bacterium]
MIAPDVAVVGAGFAGLSAAAALAEAGKRVLVLDARPQLGGRATAFVDRVTGELVDNGQHVLFGCYRETFTFLRRVGAEDNVRVQSGLSIPFVDRRGRRSVLQCPPLPAPLHLLGGVLDWDALPWADRFSILRVGGPILRARRAVAKGKVVSLAPPDETVSAWLSRHGQGRKLRAWLWDPLAVAALNQAPEEAAAAPFVRVLAEMFAPDASAAALVLPTKPLHLMYAEPARRFIEARGGEVRTGALTRIVTSEQCVEAVDIRGERVPVRQIVAAVPWFALRTLFASTPPASLEQTIASADRMESKPIVTVNLWYDGPVIEESFVGLPGRVMQWVFDKRYAFGETASHLSLVSSGADALVRESDEALIRLAAQEVDEAFPATDAELVRGTVIREKRATFSLAPGQPARPGTRTPVRGLYLAGDWLDTGLPGTIESAVLSGHRAAEAVRTAQP